ncbi:acetylcholine receptor subunit alpha-like [Saccostrea echinata]|uniref:acetylcholine receptor subunit alpha-like n=1 Tax=Saccostrea echinata TaxID=191078 RepID=UPI002A7F4052|nr:acetylcholine receptor subunit alpha-like [Saccostrea echinata]
MTWKAIVFCFTCILKNWAIAANVTDIENLYTDLILYAPNQELLKNVRPSEKTIVTGSLHLLSISGLDEISGTFSVIVTLTLTWRDKRLRWVPSAYGNLKSIELPQDKVWIPSIMMRYPVKKVKKLGMEDNLVTLSRNGTVALTIGDFLETACSFDVTHFPFDHQSCDITLLPWIYSKDAVDFRQKRDDVDLGVFSKSGMWEISSTKASVEYILTSDNIECAMLKYTIYLERRSSYFVLTIFVPVIMLLLLNSAVFLLPSESGERVGYAITCLLALAVFLTLTDDVLPRTSKPLSVLSCFLMLLVLTSAVICLTTIISVWLHHKDEKSHMSLYLKKFTHFMLCRNHKTNIAEFEIVDILTEPPKKQKSNSQSETVTNPKNQKHEFEGENTKKVTKKSTRSSNREIKTTSSNGTVHVTLKSTKKHSSDEKHSMKPEDLKELYNDITWKTFSELFNFLCLVGTLAFTALFGSIYVLIAGGNL